MAAETGARIRSAQAVDARALEAFYRELYPDRPLAAIWRWLYRTSRPDNPLPLVMVLGNQVVAHAGGIPFTARLGMRHLTAQWFVDFALLPPFRKQGLGTELTRAWMKAAEVSVTFCNEASMRVFRRLGWIGSTDTPVHTVWLRPSAHRRLRRAPAPARGIVDLGWRAAQALTGSLAGTDPVLQHLDAGSSMDLLRAAMESQTYAPGTSEYLAPLRDADFLTWRINQSPRRELYRLFRDGDVTMLIALADHEPKRLDVLWMPDLHPEMHSQIRGMLGSLARWARAHGYCSVRYLPSDPALASSLRSLWPEVSRPQFACWAADAGVLQQIGAARGRWQLLDSDFEWT